MSRTDKTRPLWVKVLDHPRWLVEVHDHTSGQDCDLPVTPVWGWAEGRPSTRCHWDQSAASFDHPEHRCGCPFCADKPDRRRKRRRERAEARRYSRGGWVTEYR